MTLNRGNANIISVWHPIPQSQNGTSLTRTRFSLEIQIFMKEWGKGWRESQKTTAILKTIDRSQMTELYNREPFYNQVDPLDCPGEVLLLQLAQNPVVPKVVGARSHMSIMTGKIFIAYQFTHTILESYFHHLQYKNKYNLLHKGILMSTLRLCDTFWDNW